jgi:hypothetical protein
MANNRNRLIVLFGALLTVAAVAVRDFSPGQTVAVLVIVAFVAALALLAIRWPGPNWRITTKKTSPMPDSTGPVDIDVRVQYVEDAKGLPFLDAVFLIDYYNVWVKRWGPSPHLADIVPKEVFSQFDQDQYAEALSRARKLMGGGTAVGRSFHRYSGEQRTYEEQLAIFHDENPGFREASYDLASDAGKTDMR